MGYDLGMQYIKDGNGNYYKVNRNDQLVAARDRDEASAQYEFDLEPELN